MVNKELTFEAMKELLKGEMGIHGLEGRSPIHVMETEPIFDVQQGDLWYKPAADELYLFDGDAWNEIAKQGIIGLEGEAGKDGKDSTVPGPKGDKGNPGKDADISEVKTIAGIKAKEELKVHESKFDHKFDPFIIGTKKINEQDIADGRVVTYDSKTGELVYREIPKIKSKFLGGGGTTLPQRTGHTGEFLKVGTDNELEWGTAAAVVSFSDREVPTGLVNGTNVTFTLAHIPTVGSEMVFMNGVLQQSGVGNDYTIAGAVIAYSVAPESGSILLANYRY